MVFKLSNLTDSSRSFFPFPHFLDKCRENGIFIASGTIKMKISSKFHKDPLNGARLLRRTNFALENIKTPKVNVTGNLR